MAEKNIYFRSRGGSSQGWGNIFRLVSFAAYCRQKEQYSIIFLVEGPKEVSDYIKRHGFRVVELPEDISLAEESKVFSCYPKSDIIIVEMLDCNYLRQRMLKEHCSKLVVFDDLLDHIYCADFVVCGQALPDYGNKEVSDPSTQFFLGFDYFLCRPEFIPFTSKTRNYSESIKNVLISLGGGRYDVAYLKVAHALKEFKETINPTFILGYAPHDRIREEIKKILPSAIVYGGIGKIEEIFWQSDLAIVSGGYNKIEAAITATPALIIAVQWHQIPLACEFSKKTRMPYIGYMSYITLDEIKNQIKNLMPLKMRQEIGNISRNVVDGHGFERVYSIICSS